MYILWSKAPVIIYHRGGDGGGGGGWTILGGITWFLEEQKGGSVVTENPKGGITENLGRIQRETTQICLQTEDMERGGGRGGGESRKTSKVIGGADHFSEGRLKGGIG